MRSPITGMVIQYNELTPEEQKVFLDLVDPQPEPEAPAKQTRKKRAARTPKLTGLPKPGSDAPKADDSNAASAGEGEGPMCGICYHGADYQDHFKPSPNFHEFVGPKSKKAAK